MAGAAISAVEGIGIDSGVRSLSMAMEGIFDGWCGSKAMIAFTAVCIVLVIAARGIEDQ
ncbi:MAG: hypothetical protein WAX67_08955 [Rugosibacter sp.]